MRWHRGTTTSFCPHPDGLVPSAGSRAGAVITSRQKAHSAGVQPRDSARHMLKAVARAYHRQCVKRDVRAGPDLSGMSVCAITRLGSSTGPPRGTHGLKTTLRNPTRNDSYHSF